MIRVGLTVILSGALALSAGAEAPLPERLSETGLYVHGTLREAPGLRAFAPQYPLWTDGAAKSRWLALPAGGRIDARDPDHWVFPVGTRLWKEFAFGGRRIETRLLWRSSADAWTYASYRWNDAQTEAVLVPAAGAPGVAEIAPGKWHSVPSRDECRACHENGRSPVLGFTALQLSDDRDPLAPHAERLEPGMVTLRTLLNEGLLAPVAPELEAAAPRIPGAPRTRAALGYLTGNCGHCHNDHSVVATVRFPLLMPAYASAPQVDAVVTRLMERMTKWDIPHAEPGTTALLAPGTPDRSALIVRMRSRRPSSQMPPMGTVLPDTGALELVSAWIQDLRAGGTSGEPRDRARNAVGSAQPGGHAAPQD